MASQNRLSGVLLDDTDGSLATLTIVYDDLSLLVTGITVANNTNFAVFGSATSTINGRSYSGTFAAHTTQTIPVGSNQAQRLQLSVTPSGKLDGVALVWGWAP